MKEIPEDWNCIAISGESYRFFLNNIRDPEAKQQR